MRGANATARPLTGDAALRAHGFSSALRSDGPGDGLELFDCRITNAVKCLPPNNRPMAYEIAAARIVVTLGGVADKATIRALGLRQRDHPFDHAADYALASGHRLIASYYCSRYNRNTGRLMPAMFDTVFSRARAAVDSVRDLSSSSSSAS